MCHNIIAQNTKVIPVNIIIVLSSFAILLIIVIFVYKGNYAQEIPNDDQKYILYSDPGVSEYIVTTADNRGEDYYSFFSSIENNYPRLKGLKNLFKSIDVSPKEKAEYDLEQYMVIK